MKRRDVLLTGGATVAGMAYLQIDKFVSFPAYYTPDRFPRASTGPVRWEMQVQTLIGRLESNSGR